MTVREASAKWGVHLNTIMGRIKRGEIPGAHKVLRPGFQGPAIWVVPDDTVITLKPRGHKKGTPNPCSRVEPAPQYLDACMNAIHRVWAERPRVSTWGRMVETRLETAYRRHYDRRRGDDAA